jgi:hypothetical protein
VSLHRLIDVVFCEAVDLLAEIVLLQQVAEAEDRGLIRALSLIRSMPAKRRIDGTSISASSIAGSLRSYYCCIR